MRAPRRTIETERTCSARAFESHFRPVTAAVALAPSLLTVPCGFVGGAESGGTQQADRLVDRRRARTDAVRRRVLDQELDVFILKIYADFHTSIQPSVAYSSYHSTGSHAALFRSSGHTPENVAMITVSAPLTGTGPEGFSGCPSCRW